MHPKVAIIILNWNGKVDTLECLESVYQIDYPNFEIIVVDNGSEDDSVEAIRENFPQTIIIENETNLGFAAGNNVGIRYALEHGADHLWILNNDTTVEPDSLTKLVDYAEANPKVGMLSPVIYFYDQPGEVWFAGGHIDWRTGSTYHIEELSTFKNVVSKERYICGCAILIRKKFVEEIGMLDERFFPAFYEDTDWAVRCAEGGYQLDVVEDSKIYHKVGRSSGKRKTERFRRLLTKSRFSFMEKYQDSFGNGLSFHRKFIAGCIEDYAIFLNHDASDEADGLFNALLDIYQRKWIVKDNWVNKLVQKNIMRHPYFWANVIRGDWVSIRRSLWQKIGA